MDILVKIIAYVFVAFLTLGIIGLAFTLIEMIISILKGETPSGMPWWTFWSALHHDD